MIIRFEPGALPGQITQVQSVVDPDQSESRKVLLDGIWHLVTSAQWSGDEAQLAELPGVAQVLPFATEYQLSSRMFRPTNTVVDLGGGIVFGTDKTIIAAGPCAVESEYQVMKTAEYLVNHFNIKLFRAGVYKPRTSPYSFQGLGSDGIWLLEKVRTTFDVKIITEVKDNTHLDEVAAVADIIQIGTKSMYNFTLLTNCGKLKKPILLKRGFMTTLDEFLRAADFILCEGNTQVILCERGIRTFEPQTRFNLDVCGAALLKRLSHLPLVLDPSHAMGIRSEVPLVAQSCAALGVDGLLIEVHPNPEEARSDRAQALSLEQFSQLYPVLTSVCAAVGRKAV